MQCANARDLETPLLDDVATTTSVLATRGSSPEGVGQCPARLAGLLARGSWRLLHQRIFLTFPRVDAARKGTIRR